MHEDEVKWAGDPSAPHRSVIPRDISTTHLNGGMVAQRQHLKQ